MVCICIFFKDVIIFSFLELIMDDILSEKDALLLLEAIEFRQASKVAGAIFLVENVLSCIKALLLDQTGHTAKVKVIINYFQLCESKDHKVTIHDYM